MFRIMRDVYLLVLIFLINRQADSAAMSTLTAERPSEVKTARKWTGHPHSYIKAEKRIKSLAAIVVCNLYM